MDLYDPKNRKAQWPTKYTVLVTMVDTAKFTDPIVESIHTIYHQKKKILQVLLH